MPGASTLTEKIIAAHSVGATGEEIAVRVDQILLEDATGTMACLQFERLGLDRVAVPLVVSYVDHNTLQFDNKNPEDHAYLRSFAARYGLLYSRPGNGISHYLHLERFARPGHVLIGADSHTTMAGALGMLAIGAGATEVAVAMAGRPYWFERPLIVGVELRGRLTPWVQSKDVVLELLRRRGVRGGRGRIFEFHGAGVASLSATDRGTICNMVMETGATTGIFPSDEQTRRWLASQGREAEFVELAADPGARYDEAEEIDLAELEPLIAQPSSPENVVPVREAAGIPTRQVCVGSSVNSSYEDLAVVAAVLARAVAARRARPDGDAGLAPDPRHDRSQRGVRGPTRGRRAHPRARLWPVHRHGAGAARGCGLGADVQPELPGPQRHRRRSRLPVLACNGRRDCPRRDDRRSAWARRAARARPAARQHGRGRPPDRAAAAGRAGERGRPRKRPQHRRTAPRAAASEGDRRARADRRSRRRLDGRHGARRRARARDLVEHPGLRGYMFRRFDKEFPARAEEWGGGIVVGGHNYGQGSSREQAAFAALYLGVRAVVAKSFARIHRTNLIAQGIPPLTFAEESDYEGVRQGDEWRIAGVRAAVETGETTLLSTVPLELRLTAREREILLAGGLVAYARA